MEDFDKFEAIRGPRFDTDFVDGKEWIVARASKNWFVILFISVWLLVWTAGGIAALTQLLGGEAQLFLGVWLVGWAVGWVFAASWLGWQLAGQLQITTDGPALLYRWEMPLLSKLKRYDVRQIRNVRAGSASFPWGGKFMDVSYPPFFPDMPGSVQFDYGGRTVNVMSGLDQTEGQAIAAWLTKRLPNQTKIAEH